MDFTLLKQSIPIIVVAILLSIAFLFNSLTTNNSFNDQVPNQCYLESENCIFEFDDKEFTVKFDRFPIQIEEMLLVTLMTPSDYRYESGWVEGTNMFMGKTTLFLQQSRNELEVRTTELELFLGACSEINMRWRMVINLNHTVTGENQRLSIFFQTTQS